MISLDSARLLEAIAEGVEGECRARTSNSPDRAMFCVSAPVMGSDVKAAVRAVDDSMHELQPYIETIWPDLIGTL